VAIENQRILIHFITLGILMELYLVFGLYFIRKFLVLRKERKTEEIKDYKPLIYGLFYLLFFIGQIFISIFNFLTEFNTINVTIELLIVWKIGATFNIIGWLLIFILMEKRLLNGRDKYILTGFYCLFYGFGMMSSNMESIMTFMMIAFMFSSYIPFAFIYIAAKSNGIIRRRANYIFTGSILLFLANLMTTEYLIRVIIQVADIERIDIHTISYLLNAEAAGLLLLGFKEIYTEKKTIIKDSRMAVVQAISILFLTGFIVLISLIISAWLFSYIDPVYSSQRILQLKIIGFFFYLLIVILLALISIKLLLIQKNKNTSTQKFKPLILILFFIVIGISYIINIYIIFFIPSNLNIFYAELVRNSDLTYYWRLIQYLILYLGFGFLTLYIELYVLKKRTLYVFSFVIFLSSCIGFFLPYEFLVMYHVIPSACIVGTYLMLIFLFIYLSVKERGVIVKKSIYVSCGLILFFLGISLNPLTGTTIFYANIFLEVYMIIMPILSILGLFFFYLGLKEWESLTFEEKEPETLPIIEDIFMFKKSHDLSEEEVTFYREQKICLVCKGNVKRFNYICPKCDALYCYSCADALSNLENECWICQIPFDESKGNKEIKKKKKEKPKIFSEEEMETKEDFKKAK